MKSKEVALKLANAQSEKEVNKILNTSFFEEGEWRPLGYHLDISSNYSIVENQQAQSVSALVEIIINSIDAVLLKRAKETGKEKSTRSDVVDSLTKDEKVSVVADGSRKSPNIIVWDTGEGQLIENFEKTFLGLFKAGELKKEYPFLQGQYGMGSSGVLPFCGDKGYKLIVSASYWNPEQWSWTIIRKNRELERYEYIVLNGFPPTFTGQFEGLSYGTYTKMYNYELDARSQVTGTSGLRDQIDRFIIESDVPIEVRETRDYTSDIMYLTTYGGLRRIEDSKNIQKHFQIVEEFPYLGKREINIVLFKKGSNNPITTDKSTIFLTINGQTHASFGRTFIENRCKRKRIAKDVFVHINFSDLKGARQVDLFAPSRDRLKETKVAKEFEKTLHKIIEGDETLKKEEQRRYEEAISKSEIDYSTIENFIEKLCNQNPDLRKYLRSKGRIENPEIPDEKQNEQDFPFEPTLFRVKNWNEGKKGRYLKRMPINKNGQIYFELNAPNDYFTREMMRGEFKVTPPEVVKGWRHADGILILSLKAISQVGDTHMVKAEVTRITKPSLVVYFDLEYLPLTEEKQKQKTKAEPPAIDTLGIPEPIKVWKDSWQEWSMDGETPVIIENKGNGKANDLKVAINMDAIPLVNYKKRRQLTDVGIATTNKLWEIGILLYSFISYLEFKKKYGDEVNCEEFASIAMRGVAQTMLDIQVSELVE